MQHNKMIKGKQTQLLKESLISKLNKTRPRGRPC